MCNHSVVPLWAVGKRGTQRDLLSFSYNSWAWARIDDEKPFLKIEERHRLFQAIRKSECFDYFVVVRVGETEK